MRRPKQPRTRPGLAVLAGAVIIVGLNSGSPWPIRAHRQPPAPASSADQVQADSPQPLRVLPEPVPAPPAPHCAVTEVSVEFVREHHAVGHDWLSFRLTNTSSGDCQLAGDPVVTARLSELEPVVASRGVVVGGWPEAGPAATLPPGEGANLSVILNPPCQRQRPSPVPAGLPPAALELALPGGPIELPIPDTVTGSFRPNGICSFSVSGFERFRPLAR